MDVALCWVVVRQCCAVCQHPSRIVQNGTILTPYTLTRDHSILNLKYRDLIDPATFSIGLLKAFKILPPLEKSIINFHICAMEHTHVGFKIFFDQLAHRKTESNKVI